jgi:hypothetical protein
MNVVFDVIGRVLFCVALLCAAVAALFAPEAVLDWMGGALEPVRRR